MTKMSDNVNHPLKWERDYQRGTVGWSLKTPTPVFQHLLAETDARGKKIFPPGRMLVPGAGLGHDAREFAKHGFDVVAIDFAQDAADAMRDAMDDATRHEIVQSDFFELPRAWNETFDYVLEYTCFCAIDPTRRAEYADTVTRLLKRGGIYIALVFPLVDSAHSFGMTNGPPFAVTAEELPDLFFARAFVLLRREIHPATIKPRKGREILIVMQKT